MAAKAAKKSGEIIGRLRTFIPAGKASASPPLGPQLGQKGVNISQFCKEFNDKTKDFKPGVPIPTRITFKADRSYSFETTTPPVSYFLKQAAGIEKGASKPVPTMLRVNFPAIGTKKSEKAALEKVLAAICAILNSCGREGGELTLFSENCPYSRKDDDDITRKIEQKLQSTFDSEATVEILTRIRRTESEHEMRFKIQPTPLLPLCTINYNLVILSDAQVLRKPSNAELERITANINGEQRRETNFVLGKHVKEFSYEEQVDIAENKETQLKFLEDKDNSLAECSLAFRMTNESNKLAQYVSGFANGSGGHIYYGIKLVNGSYIVYGQRVYDKDTIIRKVEETIHKMLVWPHKEGGCVKRGEHWNIYFEKVSNTNEPRYVIVISVNSHDKGVFVKAPESYHIVEGKPEQLTFADWMKRFLMADYRNLFALELPECIGRCKWSCQEAQKKHMDILQNLVLFRNNGDANAFEAYKTELQSPYNDMLENFVRFRINGDVTEFTAYKKTLQFDEKWDPFILVMSLIYQQNAGNFFRKGCLDKAELELKENESLLKEAPIECNNVEIYQIRRLYWLSVVKRAQGKYEESKCLCNEALQRSHDQPNILVVPWISYNLAKMLEIEIATSVRDFSYSKGFKDCTDSKGSMDSKDCMDSKGFTDSKDSTDSTKERNLKTVCLKHYQDALRRSFKLQDFPEKLVIDLRQRVLIAMARLSLGAFSDGKGVVHKECSPYDIVRAKYICEVLDYSVNEKGWEMTKLAKAEYQLVRSERHLRNWERNREERYIESAKKMSRKALKSAEDKNFRAVCSFSQEQIKILDKAEEKL